MDPQNKVDMSLDEIIKLNKKEKKQAMQKQSGGRGRGGARGRGRGRGRSQNNNNVQQVQTKAPGGGATRGRGNMRGINRNGNTLRGRGRGRGNRGSQPLNTAVVSPLNRKAASFKTINTRGRGRGRGKGAVRKQVYTNSYVSQQQTQTRNGAQQAQQKQRLAAVKTQAALLRQKEMALKRLQTAKQTMQDINKQLQQTARGKVLDNRRGINTVDAGTGQRGRRKLLTGLISSSRRLINTSVTINNPTPNNNINKINKKRRWQAKKNADVTIQVANQNQGPKKAAPQKQSSNIIEQLNKLKPAVSTTYKFQKNMFASSTTNLSLNDRFSSSSSSLQNNGSLEGRKVFV